MSGKVAFLWRMEKGYAKIIEKLVKVGGRFQRAAAFYEDRKRRDKSKGVFKRISSDSKDGMGGL